MPILEIQEGRQEGGANNVPPPNSSVVVFTIFPSRELVTLAQIFALPEILFPTLKRLPSQSESKLQQS